MLLEGDETDRIRVYEKYFHTHREKGCKSSDKSSLIHFFHLRNDAGNIW